MYSASPSHLSFHYSIHPYLVYFRLHTGRLLDTPYWDAYYSWVGGRGCVYLCIFSRVLSSVKNYLRSVSRNNNVLASISSHYTSALWLDSTQMRTLIHLLYR